MGLQHHSPATKHPVATLYCEREIPAYLHSVLPLREMCRLLLLLLRHEGRLVLVQPPPDRPSLLWTQVEREVFFLCIEEAQLLPLVGVDDC